MAKAIIKDERFEKPITFWIDDRMKKNLDDKVIPSLHKKDKDYVICIDGGEGTGKCQPSGSKVLMADGSWKNIEDIKIGDKVISPQTDGTTKFANVIETTNWYCNDVHNIIAINKHKKLYSCSGNHLIPISYKNKKSKLWQLKHITPKEIINNSKLDFKRNNKSLACPPISEFYGKTNCIVDAYTLGAMLGDGCMGNMKNKTRTLDITTIDEEIVKEIEKVYAIMSICDKRGTLCKRYRFSHYNFYTKIKALALYDELNSLGLIGKTSGDKFIPKEALYSDLEYRKRLLAGLIDTDGYRCSQTGYEITLKSRQLIEDISFLVYSLGGYCGEIRKCIKGIKSINFKGEYFRLSFNFPYNIDLPCKVNRKKRKVSTNEQKTHRNGIYVLRSEKTNSCQVYGFEIDSDSHWYITDNFQVTHNSTLAFQIGKYVDPSLNLSRIVFSPEEFRQAVFKAKKGECIIYDEAFTGFSSRAALSGINRALVSLAMQFRQKNLFVIIVLPTIFLLDKYLAMFRTKILIHVYENHGVRGYFRVYPKKLKKYLILSGQKTYSYKVRTNFKGRFYGVFALGDEEEEKKYRKMKGKALEDSEKSPMSAGQVKYREQRNLLIHLLKKETKLTYRKMEEYLNGYDLALTYQQIAKICVTYGDTSLKEAEVKELNDIPEELESNEE